MAENVSRTAIIAGATGLTGGFLLNLLLEDPRYESVVALVRREIHPDSLSENAQKNISKLRQEKIDFDQLLDDPVQFSRLFKGDDLFCCLGTTIKKAGSQAAFRKVDFQYVDALARAAVAGGMRQFLLVSAMGADPGSMFFYNKVKGETEAAVTSAGFSTTIICRPSLILGEREESRGAEQLAQKVMGGLDFLLQGSLRKFAGISAETIARALHNLALSGKIGNVTLDSGELHRIAAKP